MPHQKRLSLLAPVDHSVLTDSMSPLTLEGKQSFEGKQKDSSPASHVDPAFLEAALHALEKQQTTAEGLKERDRAALASPTATTPPSYYSSAMHTPGFGTPSSSSSYSDLASAFTPLSMGMSRQSSSRGDSRRASKSFGQRPSLGERRASSNSIKTGIYTPPLQVAMPPRPIYNGKGEELSPQPFVSVDAKPKMFDFGNHLAPLSPIPAFEEAPTIESKSPEPSPVKLSRKSSKRVLDLELGMALNG